MAELINAPLNANGWISVPWVEFVGKDGSHGASFSSGWEGNSQSVFNIIVNWLDGLQAEQDILGTSWLDITGGTPGVLRRTMPAQHPYKTSQRASRLISTTPMKWTGKDFVAFEGSPAVGGNVGAISEYAYWMISIGFETPTYRVIDDATLNSVYGGNEWKRFTLVGDNPSYQAFVWEAGSWQWADNTGGGAGKPTVGQPFPAPWADYIYSNEFDVTWKRIPRRGLYRNAGEDDFLISNIRDNIGAVHNGATSLWGVDNTTANDSSSILRLKSVKTVLYPSPFTPVSQGLGPNDPNTFYDVIFTFHIFDPPTPDGAAYFGHNLAPNRGDGLWYLLTNTASGRTVYPTADLTKVFQLDLELN